MTRPKPDASAPCPDWGADGAAEPHKIAVAFLFIGGMHQALHSAPAAAELACDERFRVVCLVAGAEERAMVARVAAAWPKAPLGIVALPPSRLSQALCRLFSPGNDVKVLRLWRNRRLLAGFDAVVVPERTSTILKAFGLRAKLIYIPHGGGDRAVAVEPRIKRFDYVLAPGAKNAERMIAVGSTTPEKCAVAGWVKLAAVPRLAAATPRFFADDKPVVLYNPHFRRNLSSWPAWGRKVVAAFAAQDAYHLILAPHIRMFKHASAAERAAFESLSVPGHILVDAGSMASCDMRYTLAADVYMGDVSSQVYEFLSQPRPCVFLNAHKVAWRDDPSYAGWTLGEVVDDPADVLAAVARAVAAQPARRPLQEKALIRAAGADWPRAAARAASLIADYLLARRK